MRMLVAEDDLTSRKLLGHILRSWGFEVLAVCDGRQAWEALGGESPPPLAILDWMMPKLDGVEVCRRVRRLATSRPPYIILLTARSAKQDIVAGLDAGANDFLTKPFDREELRARVEVGRRFVELNQELLESREKLVLQARTDALTGVMNRRAVVETLEQAIARAEREGDTIAVGMMDIDFFKRINDTYGHVAGDEVLKKVVVRATKALRSYDLIGRFGGEEFLLILTGTGMESARRVLERVRKAVSVSPVNVGEHHISVTVSIGSAVRADEPIDDLIRKADDALYRAKSQGRDRIAMASPSDGPGMLYDPTVRTTVSAREARTRRVVSQLVDSQ